MEGGHSGSAGGPLPDCPSRSLASLFLCKSAIWQAAKPVAELKTRFAPQAATIDAVIAHAGRSPE
jgi:hypothetical protein